MSNKENNGREALIDLRKLKGSANESEVREQMIRTAPALIYNMECFFNAQAAQTGAYMSGIRDQLNAHATAGTIDAEKAEAIIVGLDLVKLTLKRIDSLMEDYRKKELEPARDMLSSENTDTPAH